MDIRRRVHSKPTRLAPPPSPAPAASARTPNHKSNIQASVALPLPIRHTNKLFSVLFMASLYFLMSRWRVKIRTSTPLHLLTLSEILAVSSFLASLIYLISFFGIAYVQSFISSHDDDDDDLIVGTAIGHGQQQIATCPLLDTETSSSSTKKSHLLSLDDQEIVDSIVSGVTPSYLLESQIRWADCIWIINPRCGEGDCKKRVLPSK